MSFSARNWSLSLAWPTVFEPATTPANPQDQSPLFVTLPAEVRLHIYRQLWLDCGLTQHILSLTETSYLQSFPCILSPEELNRDPSPLPPPPLSEAADATGDDNADPEGGNDDQVQSQPYDDPGDINAAIQDLSAGGGDDGVIEAAIDTPWCTHFACMRLWTRKWQHAFEGMYHAAYRGGRGRPDLRRSPVLTAFLVCKRVYGEASESLFSSVRFSFTSLTALRDFLRQVPRPLVARVQFTDIVAAGLGCGDGPLDDRTPAQQVYETLSASFPKLRELRLTLHPKESSRETVPQRQALEPLYELAREMDSLCRFEVFLPTKCEKNSEMGYGEVPPSLEDAPFTVRVVPPGWHGISECEPFDNPAQSLSA